MRNYKIANIFYSIQGEGYYNGSAAIFIRFYGCNLVCSFCDEPEASLDIEEYTEDRVIEEVKKYEPCRFVVLTGGEPTLQPCFPNIVNRLQDEGYFVSIETNGTRLLACNPDWVTVSPKTDFFIIGDELKLVYQNQSLKDYEDLPFKHFYLQPLNYINEINYKSLEQCLKVIEKRPLWKLSVQLHKALHSKAVVIP